MTLIRAVVFDVGGVLALVDEPAPWVLRWEERLGLDRGGLRERVTAIWQLGRVGAATFEDISAQTSEVLGLSDEEVGALWDDMWEWYLGNPNAELLSYLEALGDRCDTAILSNSFVGAREREEERYGFGATCGVIMYSHEEGMEKPDPSFYRLLCERLDVRPSEVVFVDDLPENVAGAREVGMRAVLFRDTPAAIADIEQHLAVG